MSTVLYIPEARTKSEDTGTRGRELIQSVCFHCSRLEAAVWCISSAFCP